MDLSIVIVTHNSAGYIEACLESVLAATPPGDLEIIVVDNRSGDDTIQRIRDRFPRVQVLVPVTRGGFARNANLGLRATSAPLFLLLNPDTEVAPDTLAVMVDHLTTHPEVGIAGCRIAGSDGRRETSFRAYPTLWTVACESFLLDRLFPGSRLLARRTMGYADPDDEQEPEWLSGAFLLGRRAVIHGDDTHPPAGWLDENLFLFVEDTEWCRRIGGAGWTLSYVPQARAIHHKGHGGAWCAWRYTLTCKGTAYYFRKHHGLLSAVLYQAILVPGLLLRAVLATLGSLLPGAAANDRRRRLRGYLALVVRVLSGGLMRWSPTSSRDESELPHYAPPPARDRAA